MTVMTDTRCYLTVAALKLDLDAVPVRDGDDHASPPSRSTDAVAGRRLRAGRERGAAVGFPTANS